MLRGAGAQEILKAHVAKTWEAFGIIEGGKAKAK